VTRLVRVVLGASLVGLVLFGAGCSGFVTASSSYTENNLPRDEDGSLTFLGYVPSAGGQVRMQARGATNRSWTTIQTVHATSSPTYADGPTGPVRGYHWFVRYTLGQLASLRQEPSLTVWVRFVARDSQNQEVILPSSSGSLQSCYFDARRQGRSVYEAAEGCFTNDEIRVSFNPPEEPPPNPCPPDLPDCEVPIEGEANDQPGDGGEGMGGGDLAP